jgi:hypothetical protein
MDANHNEIRTFRKKKYLLIAVSIFIAWCVCLLNYNCNSSQPGAQEIVFKKGVSVKNQWNEIFEDLGLFKFQFEDPGNEVYSIYYLDFNARGDHIVLDAKAKKILLFNSDGKFLKYIGSSGEGPGEYLTIAYAFMDKEDNFYLYDVSKRVIMKYSAYDYNYQKQFRLIESIHSALIEPNNNFITYRLFSEKDTILFLSTPQGKTIKTTFKPEDSDLHKFISRFRLGGMSEVDGEGLIFLYPDDYRIYYYDYDLNLRKVFYPLDHSKFLPGRIQFPENLSPVDYSKKHAKWWGKALRISEVYYVGNLLFICILTQYENLSETFFVNVHDLTGVTYAEGLEVPYSGIIRSAKNGFVYVVEDARFDENNKLVPLKLHRYLLKKLK